MTLSPAPKAFLQAFNEAFKQSMSPFSAEQLDDVWNNSWNKLMMWKGARPPAPLKESVWTATALKLGLVYWEGEPLRLDGAFYSEGDPQRQYPPYPIVVALEHEYDVRDFAREIIKLLSVRCPLKVGITYVEGQRFHDQLTRIEDTIGERFKEVSNVVGEDPQARYVFLAGAVVRRRFQLKWYALDFSAAKGPTGRHFVETRTLLE